ncbi:hypothetical protein F3J23_10790 [Chryseobacterium sp. Tr-659]|uniref:hypothetical protein n=1 Tax=Chryseobacterium sp. Tr-659 TaxID=2608340 RepID=UPI0014223587|nr:hypothetical protein [Chryseobacterium sp. Tr-659]NIF05927.1 hypothetical protein [Chryseobacterium sp. Tr-659]
MDKETIHYIITYFGNLMTHDEKLALRYQIFTYKTSNNSQLKKGLTDKGLFNTSPKTASLLQNGFDEFALNVAQRILAEVPEKIFFNDCPQCNRLARTPFAKQCRYCGYSWRNRVTIFRIDSVFKLTNRSFYFLGEIADGEINPGQLMDLAILGLDKKVRIESIEFADRLTNGKPWNGVDLGTNELTEGEQEFLKQKNPIHCIIPIILLPHYK